MAHSPLRVFRKDRHLSQRDLAELLGVARETVARWELGTHKIDESMVAQVSRKIGIPVAALRPDLAKLLKAAAR